MVTRKPLAYVTASLALCQPNCPGFLLPARTLFGRFSRPARGYLLARELLIHTVTDGRRRIAGPLLNRSIVYAPKE